MYLTLGLVLGPDTQAFSRIHLPRKKLGIRAQVSLSPGRYLSHKQSQTLRGWVQGPKSGQESVAEPRRFRQQIAKDTSQMENQMSYHEFLAYLYDHETSRDLAVGIAQAVAEAPHPESNDKRQVSLAV